MYIEIKESDLIHTFHEPEDQWSCKRPPDILA